VGRGSQIEMARVTQQFLDKRTTRREQEATVRAKISSATSDVVCIYDHRSRPTSRSGIQQRQQLCSEDGIRGCTPSEADIDVHNFFGALATGQRSWKPCRIPGLTSNSTSLSQWTSALKSPSRTRGIGVLSDRARERRRVSETSSLIRAVIRQIRLLGACDPRVSRMRSKIVPETPGARATSGSRKPYGWGNEADEA